MSTLWMGNLEPYMDEQFVTRAFRTLGEQVMHVRIIRNKMTGGGLGYCFVELVDEATAERCLRKVNGKLLPGANPPRRFKLNRATFGKQGESQNFSLFVGDLTPEVDDGMLYEFFYNRYPSCRGGKVVLDTSGNSKGCGFVQFPDERLQKRALEECQGAVGLGGKMLRLSLAANKNRHPPENKSWQSTSGTYRPNYQQYNPYQQQAYPGYYPNPNGDSYGYNYSQFFRFLNNKQLSHHANTFFVVDPNPELDVGEANRKFIELSEELYDALIDCHWQPSDVSTERDLGVSLSQLEPVHC
ncbi:unnamed protein product [Merluccius merluccius]